MAHYEDKTLQAAESTTPGPSFVPAADIFETEQELVLIADMPGVSVENLDIDLRKNILTLSGKAASLENSKENEIFHEYQTGRYVRQFTLSEVIDQSKIDAKLKNGVLRLSLPKMEKAAPRKITVNAV